MSKETSEKEIINQHLEELEKLSGEKIIPHPKEIRSKSYTFRYDEKNNRIIGWAMIQTKENIYLSLNNNQNN